MIVEINNENFVFYAFKYYDNPQCTGIDEFYDDLKRFKYIKRLFRKQKNTDQIDRLIFNHIIVLNNMFGPEAVTRLLFFKIDKKYWPQLKTMLVFLNIMPVGIVLNINKEIIQGFEIPLDSYLTDRLKQV